MLLKPVLNAEVQMTSLFFLHQAETPSANRSGGRRPGIEKGAEGLEIE